MRLLARKPACADREPDAPERWNERVSIRRAGVRGGRPAAERARRSVRSLISAIFILNTRSEDGQRQTPPDCLCSRHPTSPSARPVSGHPSRRHQRRPVPSALLRGVAPYRRPAPSRVWSQSRRTCRMPEYGNTGTHTVSDSFLRGEEGVWQGGLRRRARKNPLCSRSVRSGGRFSRCPQRSALRSLSSG